MCECVDDDEKIKGNDVIWEGGFIYFFVAPFFGLSLSCLRLMLCMSLLLLREFSVLVCLE